MKFKEFTAAGHMPTLWTSLFYFSVCSAIWVMNGILAPFLTEAFDLTTAQKGLMLSIPILSGALLRLPLGILANYIGRKTVSLLIMGLMALALVYGWLFTKSYNDILFMGVLLGISGASFGIALPLGSGSFPPKYKGFAMGIVGAGNAGVVFLALLAPLVARTWGWQATYGAALIPLALAFAALAFFGQEPPDAEQKNFGEILGILKEKDTWVFNFLYLVTFGGFIGLANFLPTFFYENYGVSKVVAGQFMAGIVLVGSLTRIWGGYLSDHRGGIWTLTFTFLVGFMGAVASVFLPPIGLMTLFLLVIFAALGVGNGAVFQLVPLRYPTTSAVASSIIGEVGALGGALIPSAMTLSESLTGNYGLGFGFFAVTIVMGFILLRKAHPQWTSSWVGKNGKAHPH
jgi:NNP family nitrate/nitrite transporter-like MFS transporter